MKDLKKYKRYKIQALIAVIIYGIILSSVIMRSVKTADSPLVMLPLVVIWVVFYISYVELKIKVEILEELKKEKSNKSSKQN